MWTELHGQTHSFNLILPAPVPDVGMYVNVNVNEKVIFPQVWEANKCRGSKPRCGPI